MFRTEIDITPFTNKITYKNKGLTIGSCFSQVIGTKLKSNKFNFIVNPFGTIYNSTSIAKLLNMCLNSEAPCNDGYVNSNGLYYHHDFHSSFYAKEKDILEKTLIQQIDEIHSHILNIEWLIITLGSSFVYEKKDDNKVVANCHKVPSTLFFKRRLSHHEMVNSINSMYKKIKKANSNTKIILCVSPVRHIKEGLEDNMTSKASLRTACATLTEKNEDIYYFPSYEIMMDDLRDYRFYKRDLIHPNDLAEDYIWEKFTATLFTDSDMPVYEKWQSVKKDLEHKAFHPNSDLHQKFLINIKKKLLDLSKIINVKDELNQIESQIIN